MNHQYFAHKIQRWTSPHMLTFIQLQHFTFPTTTGLNKSRSSPNRAITASIHLEYMFSKLKCGNEILRTYRGQKSKTMSEKKQTDRNAERIQSVWSLNRLG